MSGEVFVDTNVLVYQFDGTDETKQKLASEWLRRTWELGAGRLSFQVLQEFYNTVTRKISQPLSRDDARRAVQRLLEWSPVVVDDDIVNEAFRIEDRHQLAWWDALIVAAARSAGCRYLLTEDLQHGQSLEGLQVVNFALTNPGDLLA